VAAEDGSPSGLAVELVREAARRRGISLQWINVNRSSEAALRARQVDLWPIITITPERLKFLHLSEPYVEVEHTLLVRGDSPFANAKHLSSGRITLANVALDGVLLKRFLPGATPLSRRNPRLAIEDVCSKLSDAAFMDVYTAISTLLAQPDCAGTALRWIPVPNAQTQLGVGATPEAGAAADAIRGEIGAIARDGTAAPIIEKWGFTPAQNLISLEALVDARRRAAQLAGLAALFALLLGLACWQTLRVIRERDRTLRTEKALRDSDQKLRLISRNLKEMVLAFDMDRKLLYANPAIEAVTGYSLDEYYQRGFIDWVHPDDRDRMMGHWSELYAGSAFEEEEYRLVTKQGVTKWISATWGPFRDEDGRQIGVQGSERDITDRKQAELALLEAQRRSEQSQRLESIGRLAGGVAHDFNNLLTVISGYGDLIYTTLSSRDPLREQVDQIRTAGARGADLVRQLLAFSRKQVIDPKLLSLNDVIRSSEGMFRRLLGEDIELAIKLHPSLALVMADAGQMHQVLMNLLVNAKDAMPDGGRVYVETSSAEIDESYVARIPYATVGPAAVLQVTDSGMGMDPETCKRIFEPFFSTKGPGGGTGLGLATVYGIVRQSQGWINLYSEPGKGASFKIYLPIPLDQTVSPAPATQTVSVAAGTGTVLVVEDQQDVRTFAVHVLEAQGYRVLSAPDGNAALALADSHAGEIHLLVTDVVLPGINGRQLAELMSGRRSALKVLYTSGYPQDVIAKRGVLDADVDYLPKPYSADALTSRVRSALRPADA
jgi:PAS domain S-box-containing protein